MLSSEKKLNHWSSLTYTLLVMHETHNEYTQCSCNKPPTFLQAFQHMMAQSQSFITFVAALLISTSYCYAENVYCVTPTATSCSSCPHNSTHCATLSEYAQEAKLYFTSNTTMVFLPGDHFLDTNITVANVTRLSMHGEQSSSDNIATIVCNGSVGVSFSSMVELKIHSLDFVFCSRKHGVSSTSNYALLLQSTQYAELVNCSFHDNLGTALVVNNTSITLAGNNEFTNNHCVSNSCVGGGGITALSGSLIFTGNITFLDNIATTFDLNSTCGGAAINASGYTILNISGTSNFINNSAYCRPVGEGGAIHASDNAVLSFIGTSNFINNIADYGGAIHASDNAVLSFIGTNNFINNIADYGGAICASDNTVLSFHRATSFISNLATLGGAMFVSENVVLSFVETSNFINNLVYSDGGAIFIPDPIVFSFNVVWLSFNGRSNFIRNSAFFGGAITASGNAVLNFNGTNNFISNSVGGNGGAIYTPENAVFNFNGTSNFVNNSALGNGGGAIFADFNCTLTFNGTLNFSLNGAKFGGGVYVELNSTLFIFPNTTMYWENNGAALGGAIYAFDANPLSYCPSIATYLPKEDCFFQLPGQNLSNGFDVKLFFTNNFADIAGSVLYGGAIDHCKLTGLDSHSSGEVFDMVFRNTDTDYYATSNISSDPFRICLCESNLTYCSKSQYDVIPITAYPGEAFQVSVVAVGQRDGTVPSTVRSIIQQLEGGFLTSGVSNNSWLQESQYLQQANNTCTTLNYNVFSLSENVIILLKAEGNPCSKLEYAFTLFINVNLTQTCPPGFNISESEKLCICEQRLERYTNKCNITKGLGRITRDSSQHFWVGYDHQSKGLILHPHCPFDYCVSHTIHFPLNNTDMQCAGNRSGLLCGACKKGFTLVLGTSQCRKCTNSYLALLISFAVMGVALVFLLFVCKLTVATGTLSGLVFYANIVGVNRTIFLPVKSTDTFSVFIAWLNLDFGIETCFYNGMDTYGKIWLQFVFPVFIWVIVGLMILVSHFSRRFANMLGNNPVSVLATLILLSYTKILRNSIAVIYVTYLEYPTYKRWVWLYDANIDYLSGKHIPLFIVTVLVFLFLFLPYTLLLLFGQWLQAISHLRLFSWVNSARLKPFMDAYHAPYKAKHRYWPGLLLVFRFVLLLVFAFEFSPQQDTSINLLAILVGTGILHFWGLITGGVYRNWCLNVLEGSFALNLIILVGATYFVMLAGGNQLAVGYTSVSIVLATFLGVVVLHVANLTGVAQYLKRKHRAVAIRNAHQADVEAEPPNVDSLPDRLINPGQYEPPFHTPRQCSTEREQLVNKAQRRLTPVYTYGSIK